MLPMNASPKSSPMPTSTSGAPRDPVPDSLEQLVGVVEHHGGDLAAGLVIGFGGVGDDEHREVQRHDLVADQLVDEGLGEEGPLGVAVEAPEHRGRLGRADPLRLRREPAHVGEQHADLHRGPPGRRQLDADGAQVGVLAGRPVAERPDDPSAEAGEGRSAVAAPRRARQRAQDALERAVGGLGAEPPVERPVVGRQGFVRALAGQLGQALDRLPLQERGARVGPVDVPIPPAVARGHGLRLPSGGVARSGPSAMVQGRGVDVGTQCHRRTTMPASGWGRDDGQLPVPDSSSLSCAAAQARLSGSADA